MYSRNHFVEHKLKYYISKSTEYFKYSRSKEELMILNRKLENYKVTEETAGSTTSWAALDVDIKIWGANGGGACKCLPPCQSATYRSHIFFSVWRIRTYVWAYVNHVSLGTFAVIFAFQVLYIYIYSIINIIVFGFIWILSTYERVACHRLSFRY